MKYCMLEVAFGNKEEAHQVIGNLLHKKLIASAQVVESESFWNWKKVLESSKEYLVIMKTKEEHLKDIYDIVKSIHSYECFEFATFELNSINKDYLNWIDEETK